MTVDLCTTQQNLRKAPTLRSTTIWTRKKARADESILVFDCTLSKDALQESPGWVFFNTKKNSTPVFFQNGIF